MRYPRTSQVQHAIGTATTKEALASVRPERQLEVWQEVGGNPQHAQHVRNVIAHAWIDAAIAPSASSESRKTTVMDKSPIPQNGRFWRAHHWPVLRAR